MSIHGQKIAYNFKRKKEEDTKQISKSRHEIGIRRSQRNRDSTVTSAGVAGLSFRFVEGSCLLALRWFTSGEARGECMALPLTIARRE